MTFVISHKQVKLPGGILGMYKQIGKLKDAHLQIYTGKAQEESISKQIINSNFINLGTVKKMVGPQMRRPGAVDLPMRYSRPQNGRNDL